MLRLLAARPAALRFLRLAVPRTRSSFAPEDGERSAPSGLGCSTGGPSRLSRAETTRSPRFLESPHVCMPRSLTPASSSRQARLGVSTRPSVVLTTSALAGIISRGSITRPAHSLCTLRRADRSATTQHAVPAGGQPLPGGPGYPLGSIERFPRLRLPLFLLSQASPGALGRMKGAFARRPSEKRRAGVGLLRDAKNGEAVRDEDPSRVGVGLNHREDR